MTIDSVPALVELLRHMQLLEPAAWGTFADSLAPQFTEPRLLVKDLVQRGWLTPFQANQLFQGHSQELVLGQYVLLERLGEGGMGQVFRARHRLMNRIVALKVIRRDLVNRGVMDRFRQEIQVAARLTHPNIVLAHDADEVGGQLFLTMECVEGTDLGRLVQKNGPLPIRQACDSIRQAALGLQYAHDRGLVHRDIKPANLMLAVGGTVKILDLGLARANQEAARLTPTGSVVGSADYIAPEQALDANRADARSDIYALGCTLYYLLTSRVPFPEGTFTDKLLRHNSEEPEPLENLRPELPAKLATVVRKMMAKKPEERYETAAAVAAALAPWCCDDRQAVTAIASERGAPSPVAPELLAATRPAWSQVVEAIPLGPSETMPRPPERNRRSGGKLLAAGVTAALVSVLLLSAAVWLVLRSTGPSVAGGGMTAATAKAADPREITNSLGMKMVLIPAGKFRMGSPENERERVDTEGPQHEVTITKPFYLGSHEVTLGQFRAFVKATGYRTTAEVTGQGAGRLNLKTLQFDHDPTVIWKTPGWEAGDDEPVVCVSWNDAVAFCKWLAEKEGQPYRLPTEAEWEYACRAGSTAAFGFGSSLGSDRANFDGKRPYGGGPRGPFVEKAVRCGSYPANAWGLYDMHGNAWEWVSDYYAPYVAVAEVDPTGPTEGQQRIARGGGWVDPATSCRAANRNLIRAHLSFNTVGFRVARSVAP